METEIWIDGDLLHLQDGDRRVAAPVREVARTIRQRAQTVVCLCGSTRFYKQFQQANYDETMAGKIVLSVGFFPHASDEAHGEHVGITPEKKRELDELHMRKIDLADEILVLNVDGYVGESTTHEIHYAHETGKKVRWLNPQRQRPAPVVDG